MGVIVERAEIVQQYLAVLDVTPSEPSYDLLATLTQSHAAMFAFSSVGVRLKNDLPLDLHHLFERIVRDRRGGYCFEQNSLMFEVLQELGFKVDIKLARVIYGGDHLPGLTHRVTIALMDTTTWLTLALAHWDRLSPYHCGNRQHTPTTGRIAFTNFTPVNSTCSSAPMTARSRSTVLTQGPMVRVTARWLTFTRNITMRPPLLTTLLYRKFSKAKSGPCATTRTLSRDSVLKTESKSRVLHNYLLF